MKFQIPPHDGTSTIKNWIRPSGIDSSGYFNHFSGHQNVQKQKISQGYFSYGSMGKAYALYSSPDTVPILPPPQAMTKYCFPSTS